MDRICCWVIAWALLLPAAVQAKTIELATSLAPHRAEPSVTRANAAVGADSGRLLQLFRGLHAGMQHGRAGATIAMAVAAELSVSGFEVERAHDGSFVVAVLRNGKGPTLVYQVDARGEPAAAPPRGAQPGARHGRTRSSAARAKHVCGPDAALTWMLGMAKALSALRAEWAGTLVLVSQSARQLGADALSAARAGRALHDVPAPDMWIAFDASSAPLGSLLSVRAQRRPASNAVDFAMNRVGVYEMPRYLDSASRLSDALLRRYALPELVPFGYVLVGIADRGRHSEAPDLPGEAPSDELDVVAIDIAAIPLGAKLATVAALELLAKPRATPSTAASVNWTKHRY